ncbi:MAG: RlmE family RNA methyltransferase [Deltaproteobacteria bacterium]|nr:RlmE family RNA methyltransferase [Deltaproteobacteria bacterium]
MTIKDRQRLDDHYSRLARKEGYPARSVYKLEEFDMKYKLFRPGLKVLDLGCAPGGWTLYAAGKVGPRGLVVGLDLNKPSSSAFPEQVKLFESDLLAMEPEVIAPFKPFDLVLSDMAPKTTGRSEVDQSRSLELCQAAWQIAKDALKPTGAFLFKVFQSPQADILAKNLAPLFGRQLWLKPKATRKQSMEIFILNLKFKGHSQTGNSENRQ